MIGSLKNSPVVKAIAVIFPPGRERVLLGLVGFLGLLAAIVETVGIASILPFMALIIDPDALMEIRQVREFSELLGFESARDLTVFVGIGIIILILCGNALSAFNIFVQHRFSARSVVRITNWMFEQYMRLPYAFHVKRDVSSVTKVMMGDSVIVMFNVITPLLAAFGKALVAIGIVALLVLVDPNVAMTVSLALTVAYVITFRFIRKSQRTLGEQTNRNYLHGSRTAIETLLGVKELIVLGRERYALGEFRDAFSQMQHAQALNVSISSLPRYILETLAFGGIVAVSLVLVLRNPESAQASIPLVALYGFSAYRLIPALQQVFSSAVSIRYHQAAVESFNSDIEMLRKSEIERMAPAVGALPEVHFRKAIELKDVTFTYEDAPQPALSGINLTIRPNESIGLVGRTGAGKTTLADIILGLYEPDSGQMLVDGMPMTGPAIRAWQKRVGFVSQHVFLRNASIAENIALGIPPDEIDRDALERAAVRAQADEFIKQLPDGFDSAIGAGGVRLSGGQRQRLGIARALYHEPEVLVFDEATSALDGMTEDAVMDAIEALSGERTVILIAHRMRTVEACDRIVMLDQGKVVSEGSYQELLRKSSDFQRFVGRAESNRAGQA